MRTRIVWLAMLLTAGMALAPTTVRAQQLDYEVPQADPVFPLITYSPRPELGGFFFAGEFIYWRQTNPMQSQLLAVRGLVNSDGASPPGTGVGAFVGSGVPALDAKDVGHPDSYTPGFHFALGYRFQNGVVVEGNYWHLFNTRYIAGATLAPPNSVLDGQLANTFLFSPVFNFPLEFAGPNAPDILPGNPLGNFGIWNAADEMALRFEQRLDKWELKFRIPIWETEYDPASNPQKIALRTYGMWGLRHYWLWERFWWRTVDRDVNGNAGPDTAATYTNLLSQPMYGPFVGWGAEMYEGHGLSLSIDFYTGLYMDFVREITKWERDDRAIGVKRSRRVFTPVPETEAMVNLWWYPIEGVQIRLGYDLMVLYNTIYMAQVVDTSGTFTTPQGQVIPGLGNFNMQENTPLYQHRAARFIDGLNIGIGFIF